MDSCRGGSCTRSQSDNVGADGCLPVIKGVYMQKIHSSKARIFKIENRRGYGCICMNNLTEGKTPLEAYSRMVKAQKRKGRELCQIDLVTVKKLIKDL